MELKLEPEPKLGKKVEPEPLRNTWYEYMHIQDVKCSG